MRTNEKNEILSAHLYNGFTMGMQYIQEHLDFIPYV